MVNYFISKCACGHSVGCFGGIREHSCSIHVSKSCVDFENCELLAPSAGCQCPKCLQFLLMSFNGDQLEEFHLR